MFEYLKEGRCFGPITRAELLALVDTGMLGPEDAVREQGDLGYRPARVVVGLLRAAQQVEASQPPPRLVRSSRPAVGGYTVFTTLPPIPPNPVPQLDPLQCAQCGKANPAEARFCGECGVSLAT